jgi:hypothetical protein
VRRAHAGESILAFSEWRSTILAYWLALRRESGVGMLSAREAHIASGRIRRDELLARFAPRAQGVRAPADHERVTLLLTTDLLSEGVNLQDASVVVHLDLPWNPARLAQRLGRIRRPGGAREVASYLVSPPARAAQLLGAESRLRAKLARTERAIGRSVAVLPALSPSGLAAAHDSIVALQCANGTSWSAAEMHGEIARRLTSWRATDDLDVGEHGDESGVIVAVRAESTGWIALLDDGGLVATPAQAQRPRSPSDSPGTILRALELAAGAPRRASDAERAAALRELTEWIAREWTQSSSGLAVVNTPMRRRMRRAIDDVLRHAPRHRRAEILRCAATLRGALTGPLTLGVERALGALAAERSTRADWLAVAATLATRKPIVGTSAADRGPLAYRVLILFGDADGH